MVYIAILLSFCYLLWRGSYFLHRQQGKIYFDPSAFFLITFLVLAFVPQVFIYSMENFEAYYITFSQEQTAVTMIAVCVFGICWVTAATAFSAPPAQTFALYNRAATPGLFGPPIVIAGAVLALLSLGLHLFLFRDTGSVSGQILLGLVTGNFTWVYENYNAIRYATTKQLFLESGVRGMGTLTTTMEYLLFTATAVVFHVTKGAHWMYAYGLRLFFVICSLLISLSTGARTKAAYCVIFVTVLAMLAFGKNRLRMALQGAALVFGALMVLTALTPKTGSTSAAMAVFYRLSGNAVNDAAIIEIQHAGEFAFKNGTFGKPQEFEALDRQLTYYFTGNPDLTWYETPTAVARYFVQGGFIGVAINGILLGLICRFGSFLLRREQDPVMLLAGFPILCVINLQLPLAGWFVPSLMVAAFVCLSALKCIRLLIRMRPDQPPVALPRQAPETPGPHLPPLNPAGAR